MEVLGVGPLELLFIFLIALIILGPTDMVKAGRTLGRLLRKVVTSQTWQEIIRLRTLPNKLIREAGLEEELEELRKIQKDLPKGVDIKKETGMDQVEKDLKDLKGDFSDWTGTPSPTIASPPPPAISSPKGMDEREGDQGVESEIAEEAGSREAVSEPLVQPKDE
jgi:Sec-independent protein translocase protein TatA